MTSPHEPEDAKAERIRLLEYQIEALRDEIGVLTRRHDALVYSAAFVASRPLRAAEQSLRRLAKAVGALRARVAPQAPPIETRVKLSASTSAGRRLLIDISNIVDLDFGTGIQRVVRNVVRRLYVAPPEGVTPLAVRLVAGQLRTSPAFVADLTGTPDATADAEVEIAPGDHLLMLDMSWADFARFVPVFAAVRAQGGLVVTCVYDLIPELYRAAAAVGVPQIYGDWLRAALRESDGLLTISRAVMDELCEFVVARNLPVRAGLRVGWFHCGSEIAADAAVRTHAIRPAVSALFQRPDPVFLMVGTVEPRKGHLVALQAFEQLWAQGSPARLVIVGRKGWYVEALVERMTRSPRLGTSLIWLSDANDAELDHIYARCTAVLCPSYAEGFGLPVAEAARANRPVLCSDIPVFREVGGEGALYFRVNDAADLARTVADFLAGRRTADPARVLRSTWAQATQRIVEVVMRGQWSRCLIEDKGAASRWETLG